MLVPVTVGTLSSLIWAILGTVSLRVLSFGPLAAASLFSVSSLGMLKPPGSELLVAVLLKLPAKKKDAMSAAPAATMSRLSTHETTFLVRGFFMKPRDCNTGLHAFTQAGAQLSALRADPVSSPTRSTNRHSWRGWCSRAGGGRRAAPSPRPRRCSRRSRARPRPLGHRPPPTSRPAPLRSGRSRSPGRRGCPSAGAQPREHGQPAPRLLL